MYRILIIETGEYLLCVKDDKNSAYTSQEIQDKSYGMDEFIPVQASTKKEIKDYIRGCSYIMLNKVRTMLPRNPKVYEIVKV